jgi:hypothetical protein
VGTDTSAAAAPVGPPTVTGLSTQEAEVLEWALSLYGEADLAVPPIDVIGHDSRDGCRGHTGYHLRQQGRSTIHICGEYQRDFAEILFLHEIAHAWDLATLSDSGRTAFLELRGLVQWWEADGDRPWDELGAEQAAEIITWGLRDRPMKVTTIPAADCDSLEAGYLALTGGPPLHGFRDHC